MGDCKILKNKSKNWMATAFFSDGNSFLSVSYTVKECTPFMSSCTVMLSTATWELAPLLLVSYCESGYSSGDRKSWTAWLVFQSLSLPSCCLILVKLKFMLHFVFDYREILNELFLVTILFLFPCNISLTRLLTFTVLVSTWTLLNQSAQYGYGQTWIITSS